MRCALQLKPCESYCSRKQRTAFCRGILSPLYSMVGRQKLFSIGGFPSPHPLCHRLERAVAVGADSSIHEPPVHREFVMATTHRGNPTTVNLFFCTEGQMALYCLTNVDFCCKEHGSLLSPSRHFKKQSSSTTYTNNFVQTIESGWGDNLLIHASCSMIHDFHLIPTPDIECRHFRL